MFPLLSSQYCTTLNSQTDPDKTSQISDRLSRGVFVNLSVMEYLWNHNSVYQKNTCFIGVASTGLEKGVATSPWQGFHGNLGSATCQQRHPIMRTSGRGLLDRKSCNKKNHRHHNILASRPTCLDLLEEYKQQTSPWITWITDQFATCFFFLNAHPKIRWRVWLVSYPLSNHGCLANPKANTKQNKITREPKSQEVPEKSQNYHHNMNLVKL